MSILKKLFLMSLLVTSSFYAESEKQEKSSKSSIQLIKNFVKDEAASILSGAVVTASAYFFDKKMGMLMTGAYALCLYRLYMDKKNQQNNAKKSK